MSDNVQKALDGDIDGAALPAREQDELRQASATIDALVRAVPADPLPPLGREVLKRIASRGGASRRRRGTRPRSRSGLAGWLWRPRAISIAWRPAYALAAAALAVVVLATQRRRPDAGTAIAHTQQVLTQFVLRAPDAARVALAGDFSDWQPAYVMTRSEPGVWTVVVPLTPGIHTYSFVVDGERWVPDPMAPAVADGFGGVNSRVAVLRADDRRS